MAFIDEVEIYAKAGDGGNGVERWLHEKYKEFSGPSGGNGGKGGDVYVEAVQDVNALTDYLFVKEFFAENGEPGGNNTREGKSGDDLVLKAPAGSIIKNLNSGRVIELGAVGERKRLLRGGLGGFGNHHFKSSTNIRPTETTSGRGGEEARFHIEIELFADIGFVGLPNAGKSSLLNALTGAHSKVGAYQFTTLNPHLGAMGKIILADIPGLIEGAAEGKGLGHKFLKHIKKTKALVHLVSVENENLKEAYETVRKELVSFDSDLGIKKELILVSKKDLVDPEALEQKKKELGAEFSVSVHDDESLEALKSRISRLLM